MKFSGQLVVSVLAVSLLSACSNQAQERKQARDDFSYLNASGFKAWNTPPNSKFEATPSFQIAQGDFSGPVGKRVDIRPPKVILELASGVRIRADVDKIQFWTTSAQTSNQLWSNVQSFISENRVSVEKPAENRIQTQWVRWDKDDEAQPIKAQYRFTQFNVQGQMGVEIALTAIDNVSELEKQSMTQRYTVEMANEIQRRYDVVARQEAERKALAMNDAIPFSAGTDRTGLPVIIARTEFDNLWQRLPRALSKVSVKLKEKNQSQGTLKVEYVRPNSSVWETLGVEPLTIDQGTYNILLGDLGNRTSINITDNKGNLLPQDQLESFIPVLQAVIVDK